MLFKKSVRNFVRVRKNVREMTTINYYLDKANKKGYSPIHLRILCEGDKIKVSTGIKVKPENFDKDNQKVTELDDDHNEKNIRLKALKTQTENYLSSVRHKQLTYNKVKAKIKDFISSYTESDKIRLMKEQLPLYGKSFSFIDLFAGAGGFSEGFLQAEVNKKQFDFVLASDINENCELTHIARYNYQLGLDTEFLKKDITDPDFLKQLKEKINNRQVDVVCGGPPCQSFSLAGLRKKYDKKNDLFSNYLDVIKLLRPKYFVMENVKGLLTKNNGKVKELILKHIRSIIDINEIPDLLSFIRKLIRTSPDRDKLLLNSILLRIQFENKSNEELYEARNNFVSYLFSSFTKFVSNTFDYATSKTDFDINTIRHGLNLLARNEELISIQKSIIKEKDVSYIHNDKFEGKFDSFLESIEPENIIIEIEKSLYNIMSKENVEVDSLLKSLRLYISPIEDVLSELNEFVEGTSQGEEFKKIKENLQLYRIDQPFVANTSNYGVPQNRERVLFIGCRKDQKLIKEIKPTVKADEKVTVFEALYDLDFINNGEAKYDYEPINLKNQFNGKAEKYAGLLRKRSEDGRINTKTGKQYAQWSKNGRLGNKYNVQPAFYVRNSEQLLNGGKQPAILHNHQASKQNPTVLRRLEIIRSNGDYYTAKEELSKYGLSSKKRNYNVLKPEYQSPTVMTMPDDYIHYRVPRALTVREMARLQSFDDDFVFQGKRSTGGNKRKDEVPQYTLVGNAVPPLLARAIGNEILKRIK